MSETVAIIVAAGRGQRFGGAAPKQYELLNSTPLLRHSLLAFLEHDRIDAVLPVIHPDDQDQFSAAAKGLKTLPPVFGGETRQASVLRALQALEGHADHVLIHDGARPNVSAAVIDNVCEALKHAPGAVPLLPVTDTLKRSDGQEVHETVPRSGLYRAQTPQGFSFSAILEAHQRAAGKDLTDDASVAENAGMRVASVAGDEDNIKVTGPEDLKRLEVLMGGTPNLIHVGSGFDVHKFGPGASIMLCGVEVPHTSGLIGHSDADVALHAVVDAILGALSLGDIGDHFPPSEAKWAGAASELFVQFAAEQIQARRGHIHHVDVTIICEGPKIGPHRNAMRASLGRMLELSLDRVSVKATTTEGLGFTGRKEGIAVQATVTLGLPANG